MYRVLGYTLDHINIRSLNELSVFVEPTYEIMVLYKKRNYAYAASHFLIVTKGF